MSMAARSGEEPKLALGGGSGLEMCPVPLRTTPRSIGACTTVGSHQEAHEWDGTAETPNQVRNRLDPVPGWPGTVLEGL